MIVEQWRKIGIRGEVQEMERGLATARMRANEHQIYFETQWGADNMYGQEQPGQRARAALEQRGERQPARRPHGDLVLQELAEGPGGSKGPPRPQRAASTSFLSSVRTAWPARKRPEYGPEAEYAEAASVSMTRTS